MKETITKKDDYLALLLKIKNQIEIFYESKNQNDVTSSFSNAKHLLNLLHEKYHDNYEPRLEVLRTINEELECLYGILPSKFTSQDDHKKKIEYSIEALKETSSTLLPKMIY